MDLKLQTTALIYGTLAIILFIFPYFAYAKEFFEENGAGSQRGEYFQIIGKVIGLHLTIIFFAIAFTSIVDIMMSYRPELSPSEALKMFFQVDDDWETLINSLITFRTTVSTSSGSSAVGDSALAYQTVLNYYGVVVAFLMLAIPVIVIIITLSVAMKGDQNNGGESKIADKLFTSSIAYVFVTFLVWFHALLASSYVSIFTGVDFSFYKIMSKLWNQILLG